MSSSNVAVKWAQRADKLFITIEVTDATDVNAKFDEKTVEVTGNGKHKVGATSPAPFSVKLNLLHEIDPAQSGHKVSGMAIQVLATKKDTTAEWWAKLTEEAPKTIKWLSVDWALWKDEDDTEEKNLGAYGDTGNFGMGGGMGGMPGMGGMGGMDLQSMLSGMGGMGGLGGMGGMGGMGGGDSDDEEGNADLGDLDGNDEEGEEAHGHSHADGNCSHSH
jgi:hypothetical protein